MARLGPLLGAIVKIRWRTLLGRGSAEITGEVLLLLAAGLVAERFLKYLPELPVVWVWMGLAMFWLGMSWGREGVPGQFPLTWQDRMVVRVAELVVNPLSWVLVFVTGRVSGWGLGLILLAGVEWPTWRRGKRVSAGPSRWPALLRKDLRAAVRLFDTALAAVIVLMFVAYAVREVNMAVEAAWIVPVVVALSNSTIALNAFGTDTGTGFDRYSLLPLTGREILWSKTVSLAVLVGAQLGLVTVATVWRLGWETGLMVGVEGLSLLLVLAAWGAWVSVWVPFPLKPYRFADGGSVWAGLVAFALCLGPGMAAARGDWRVRLLVMAMAGTVCWAMLGVAGQRLEAGRERMRERLP